ncbi:MAG: triose-phosphate isomerase [Planctomycetes bacterium]|nr:triose-phosphate isomerase [Planctomycetota bacterium]
MARKIFVAGNWKMNTTIASGVALANGLKETIGSISEVDLAVFPPHVYLKSIAETLAGSQITVGAQTMYFEEKGAFTGEISAEMIQDVGCQYVLLGHSERRHVFGETDDVINRKVLKALAAGLKVILACGELLEEREADKTMDVNERQVKSALEGVEEAAMANVTIAYEPVWAIGTGKTASPDQAQEVHAEIRKLLAGLYDEETAQATRIQYGGSVKPGNAAELFAMDDIDGGLIGGASLKVEDFTAIVKAAL